MRRLFTWLKNNPSLAQLWGGWVLITIGLALTVRAFPLFDQAYRIVKIVQQFFEPSIFLFLDPFPLSFIVQGVMRGILVGFSQWVILRKYLNKSWWWIIVTAGSYSVGWPIAQNVHLALMSAALDSNSNLPSQSGSGFLPTDPTALGFIVVGGIWLWLAVGMGQWLVLRTQVQKSSWWIVAVPISELIGIVTFWYVSQLVGWALTGIITGAVLVFLLTRRIESNGLELGDEELADETLQS